MRWLFRVAWRVKGGRTRWRAGRCGERTERCRWQRKRSGRVAAVKIFSVRRKAAQKFWAPQQGHRPLRKRYKECDTVRNPPVTASPCQPPLGKGAMGTGIRIATGSVRTGLAMTGFPWSVVHGRRATARVAPTEGYKECLAGGRTGASAPTDALQEVQWAGDRKGRPYEVLTDRNS